MNIETPAPQIINPQKGSIIRELSPTFIWSPTIGALSYEFVLAEDLGTLDKFALVDYIAITSVPALISMETLNSGKTYFWRVRAVYRSSKSLWTVATFTTVSKNEASRYSVIRSYPPTVSVARKNDIKSVFVSYGAPDEDFATKLNSALQNCGLQTFFFPQHAIPGQRLSRLMREGVNKYDRVILICSRNSLNRKGVENELEETLQREAREGGKSILIPVTIDDYVFSEWNPSHPDLAQTIRDRVIADFRDALENSEPFKKAVTRLVQGIKTPG